MSVDDTNGESVTAKLFDTLGLKDNGGSCSDCWGIRGVIEEAVNGMRVRGVAGVCVNGAAGESRCVLLEIGVPEGC